MLGLAQMLRTVAFSIVLGASGIALEANAQCSKDTDCKGDRVCLDGRCVSPAEAAAAMKASEKPTPAPMASEAAPAPTPAPIPPARAESSSGESALPPQGTIGMSFGLPTGGAPTAGASYFVTSDSAIRVDLGLGMQTDPESQFDYSLEVAWRKYLPSRGRVAPFAQPGIFVNRLDAAGSSTFAVTAAVGLEYQFLDRFSVSGSTGLAFISVTKPDSTRIVTGTSGLFGNFYW